ncbi:MAG: O-antigen ligase family protein [Parcubacteria group bacterium]|nr:O-antigen ligase family protein [Parcubacteria group bacterium]
MNYLDPLILFFVLYAALAWRSLPWALTVLAGLLPAYLVRFQIEPLPSTALEAMILILVVRWAWMLYRGGDWRERLRRIVATRLFWPGVALVAASLLACFFALDLRAGLGIWRAYFVEPFLLYVIIVDVLRVRQDQTRLVMALGVSVLVLTALALVQYFTGAWLPTWEWTVAATRRATGVYTSPNALGLFVVPVAMLHLGLFFDHLRTRPSRYFSALVVAAAALSVALAFSRGAMIALLVAGLFMLYRHWSKRWTAVVAAIAIILSLLIPSVRGSLSALASFQDASGQSRLALYRGAIELIKQHPLTGTGLSGFGQAFESVRPEEYTEKLIYPHNIFLNFWTETGLFGLLAVLWIIILVFRLAFIKTNGNDLWRDALLAALLAMLIHGLIDVPYFKNDLAVLTWLLLAQLAVVGRLD